MFNDHSNSEIKVIAMTPAMRTTATNMRSPLSTEGNLGDARWVLAGGLAAGRSVLAGNLAGLAGAR
jgi:hypothetical protein